MSSGFGGLLVSVLCHNVGMAEMTFIADVMVGKLARWLRVLGLDA
jgi:hypothetical protein